MAYHWRNGLYFQRLANGSVLITSQPDLQSPASVIGEVPPAEWASIVAAVTPAGENSFTHKAAEDLHSGLTPREADALAVCLCAKDAQPNVYCPIHGAAATGRSLR